MATSGSFDTTHRVSGSYNTYAHFDWWQTGQSTANNTTSIDWTFSGRTASSHQYIYVYGASVTVDGSTKSGWSGNMYNGTQMLSGSKTIWHNSDGTKSFGASGYITQYSSSANYSGSGSWTLNTIPRKATIKSAPNFNDEDNPTINYENKAGTSVSSLQACISLTGSADDIAYRDVNKTGTSYTFNLTQAERNVLLNATKTSKTRKVSFFIKTVIGGNTFYDSREVTFSVVNANPTFSNFTYADTNSTTTAITGNNQYIIQGKSTLRATIASANKATAKKNATMVQYDFAIADYAGIEAYTTSNINKDIGVINASVDQTLKVVARDSRDNTTTVQKNVYIVPYASPSIIATATRQSNFESNTTIHIGGAMSLLSVAGVTKNAVDASNGIKWRYKESTSSTWGSWTNVASTTSADGTVSVSDFVRTFDNKKAWDLQFSITDKLGTKTINVSLGQGQPQFFIGSDGRSSVGGLPSVALPSGNTGQLEVYGDIYSKGKKLMTLDMVYPVGSIFMSMNHSTPEQVSTALGGGTWEAWGAGRVPVGVNPNDSDFKVPNKTGGAKTVTLKVDQMPEHAHEIKGEAGGQGSLSSWSRMDEWCPNYGWNSWTEPRGGGKPHENMPPFITVYMWKRTA